MEKLSIPKLQAVDRYSGERMVVEAIIELQNEVERLQKIIEHNSLAQSGEQKTDVQ